MGKHKYTFEYDDASDDLHDNVQQMQHVMKARDYYYVIQEMFEVMRYKHQEDSYCDKYGEKALDLIDDLRDRMLEVLQGAGVELF